MIGIKISQHFSMYQMFAQTLYKCSLLILTKAYCVDIIIIPLLKIRKLGFMNVSRLA